MLKMICVILVFLELLLHTSAGPGWFHQDRRPSNQGSHGSRPASPSWGDWGSSWDYHQMIHAQNGYHAYAGGSAEHYTPQVFNPTPRPTKKQTTGVIHSTNAAVDGAATGGDNAIVTTETSLVMGDYRRPVASGEMSPASSEANQYQNLDQVPQNNKNDKNMGGISTVSSGEANQKQNFDRLPQNNKNDKNIAEISIVSSSEANPIQNFDLLPQDYRSDKNMGGISTISSGEANQQQNFDQVLQNNKNDKKIAEIRPISSSEANQNFYQVPQNNKNDKNIAEIRPVSSSEPNQNQNFDQVPQNNRYDLNTDRFQNAVQNSNASDETATSEPEDELTFGAAAIGSKPVPTLNDTSAPAFHWHVGVYSKMWTPYMQICGGSLIKKDVILSAAHCFWADAEGQQPATQYAVAGGKLFRPWSSKKDQFAQRSDVSQIILPVRFRGISTSFQDDIAVVRLSSPFTYAEGLRPVCVDFGVEFEREQVVPGTRGTVAGWGLTEENGRPSQRLNFLELPYVDVGICVFKSEPSFVKYITSDKICAGDQKSGKALCRGDSGGGLVFFSKTTPYLRGIASTAAANENLCNAFAIATFTHIHAHRSFLRDNVPDIDKECARNSDKVDAGTSGDLVTGIGGESNTGVPIYVPHMSRIPYSNFYCNCNCKP